MNVPEITVADVRTPDVHALVTAHLAAMQAETPPESVHALGVAELQHPGVTLWAAREDGVLAGVAALTTWAPGCGEIKSMRVAEPFLGRGIGRALLRHILSAARERGMTGVWLETGSTDEFGPARQLYASEGFVVCEPFGSYRADPLSTFMTRAV